MANADFQRQLDAARERVAATAVASEISRERAVVVVDRWLALQSGGSAWPSLFTVWFLDEVACRVCGGGMASVRRSLATMPGGLAPCYDGRWSATIGLRSSDQSLARSG